MTHIDAGDEESGHVVHLVREIQGGIEDSHVLVCPSFLGSTERTGQVAKSATTVDLRK
jgi:hypothetical protein